MNRLPEEHGFSMILILMALFVTAMFVAAGFAAANGDIRLSGDSRDRKTAYAAAEAGLAFYQFHMDQDNDYWLKCTNVDPPNPTEPSPVNQMWDGTGTDSRVWRNVPGSQAQYTIEILPAAGYTACVDQRQETMIDPSTGTFRIRVTGRPRSDSTLKRSIIATFRRRSFLDFLWFTDYETTDPTNYQTSRTATGALCGDKYRPQRDALSVSCDEIAFVTGDSLNGPLHTNDNLLICGTPNFGRTSPDRGDRVEIGLDDPASGWVNRGGCSSNPTFVHDPLVGADPIPMPDTNRSLQQLAATDYRYVGPTTIEISGATMLVTNAAKGWTRRSLAAPTNGVVYVGNSTLPCVRQIPREVSYTTSVQGCGDLWVSGSSSKSLTLAAQNDIVIRPTTGQPNTGLLKTGNAVIGLIADNFVRVYHNVKSDGSTDIPDDVQIDAAILSLQHSFTVDNYDAGDRLQRLTINGAIAQKYRGAVGTGTATSRSTGFAKNYVYDDRLRYQTPPYFLEPVAASWNVIRRNEQVPAR